MSSTGKGWSFLSKPENKEQNKSDTGDVTVTDSKMEDKTLEAPDEKEVRMSRGTRPETDLDFEKLRPLAVYDESGNEVRFLDLFKNRKTIVVFIRHFLDFIAKEYVEDLAIIPAKYLQDANVGLIVIGPSPHKFIKSFKALTNYHYPLYCDPERHVYKALGLPEKVAFGQLAKSKHVKSSPFVGTLKSMWRAMQSQEYQGNTKQQGGAFILGPGEQAHFHHQDKTCADHMNINDLLMEAGVQPVSFPRDQRVITV